jgi:dienelactone hydrolase
MPSRALATALLAGLAAVLVPPLGAQVRVTPKAAKGGEPQGEAWAEVPDTFKGMRIPDWPVPTDLKRWQDADRGRTRETLLACLGEMPPRPDPGKVKVLSREDHNGYTLERFEFHNGVDMVVPGVLLVPKGLKGPAPAVVALHGHGSSKESVCTDPKSSQLVGPLLAKRGYVVAAIDAAFNGERVGKGPAGPVLDKGTYPQELSLFKLYLWQGRSLWGMMLREEQCLLDYLQTRPEVDRDRIGATGMSMGCTRAWWLAAIDDRVKGVVGVACFTRYTELIAHGNLRKHGIYYFVPGVLKHFDTEAVHALIAPRPHLELSGDQDGGAPSDGIEVLERKLGGVYRLYGKPDNFRSVIYKGTGHEYLPEMKDEMVTWFECHLPPAK